MSCSAEGISKGARLCHSTRTIHLSKSFHVAARLQREDENASYGPLSRYVRERAMKAQPSRVRGPAAEHRSRAGPHPRLRRRPLPGYRERAFSEQRRLSNGRSPRERVARASVVDTFAGAHWFKKSWPI